MKDHESRENANIRTFLHAPSSPRDVREGTSFHMFGLHHHQTESIWSRYPSGRRVFGQDSILAARKLFHGVRVQVCPSIQRTSNSVLFMITGRFSCCTCLGFKARFSHIGQIWRGAGMMVRDGTTSKLANNTLSSKLSNLMIVHSPEVLRSVNLPVMAEATTGVDVSESASAHQCGC